MFFKNTLKEPYGVKTGNSLKIYEIAYNYDFRLEKITKGWLFKMKCNLKLGLVHILASYFDAFCSLTCSWEIIV